MFNDKEEELQRLEEELLEDEILQEEENFEDDQDLLDEDLVDDLLYADMQVYNTDHTDVDLEELSDAMDEPPARSLQGLIVTALLLTAGIFVLIAWWAVRYLGFFS